MKIKRIILVVIGCLLILGTDNHFVSASMLADFNFVDNDVTQGFGGWYYSPYGDNACNIYNGESQSNLCSTSSVSGLSRALKYYYNNYNNDHMGWMRWGYIDSEDNLSIEGNSLKIIFTGGAYDNEGEVAYSGLEVRSKEQFDDYISNGQNPYADRLLPGGLSLYFTIEGNNNSFDELVGNDRLSLWILPPENSKHNFDNQFYTTSYSRPEVLFSWYPFVVDADGDHYYHRLSNVNMGGWVHLIFDAHPQHNNSGDSNPYSYYRAGGRDFPGDAVSYFNNVNRFSFTSKIISDSASPTYLYIDKIESYKASQPENDETIANIGVGYDPINKRFDISFDDKYRCAECSAKYEVRYSFSPITNANYDSAKLAHVTNFVRGASSVLGEIVKPANGYNEIWAGIDVDEADKDNLTNGTTIYFAVKDKSDRTHLADRDTYDLETVEVEGVGNVRRVDLIKTIDYTIYQVNRPLEIVTNSLEDGHLGVNYDKQLEATGGIYPYTWQISSVLPRGLTLGSSDGRIYGVPEELGDFTVVATVTDSHNPTQTDSVELELHIYNEESCTDGIDNDNDSFIDCQDEDCQADTSCMDVLVDFGSQAGENIFSTDWNSVFMDTYTNYTNLGPGGTITTTGNNPSYNFQGIQGSAGEVIDFKEGDKILVYWYNNLSSMVGFNPKLSFNDSDRIVNTPDQGDWYNMSYTEIEGNDSGISEYTITDNTSGNQILININSNSNNTDNLVCDKIIWLHSGVENQTRADVDNNSTINTTDAMLTLRNSLGLSMSGTNWFSSSTTGDVNCDGNSNSTDAMLILRHSLGLDMSGTGWCE